MRGLPCVNSNTKILNNRYVASANIEQRRKQMGVNITKMLEIVLVGLVLVGFSLAVTGAGVPGIA